MVNTNLLFANPFPEGRAIAIYNQSAQLVRADDLSVVPPSEARPWLPDSKHVVMCLDPNDAACC